MDLLIQKVLNCFEIHDAHGIEACFAEGLNPNATLNDQPLVFSLIDMYLRGPRFKECMKVFIRYGLEFDDESLLAVLTDDGDKLDAILIGDMGVLSKKYTLRSTFTPLVNTSLLHICAEYNHVACAKVLIKYGIDVNIQAGLDAHGFGGHTPIFHTVNQYNNNGIDMMRLLVSKGANLRITVPGLIWGEGYEWETFIPSVNPISYAMMGLLRQFQRTETDIYFIVHELMQQAYDIDYSPANIPNKYLE